MHRLDAVVLATVTGQEQNVPVLVASAAYQGCKYAGCDVCVVHRIQGILLVAVVMVCSCVSSWFPDARFLSSKTTRLRVGDVRGGVH